MTQTCASCDAGSAMARFEDETLTIEHAGMTARVGNLSGWRCAACAEVEFDPDSARRYAEAGDALVLRDRERQARDIRRIRHKLGLNQAAAARLTGGGHNAFSRYERGEVAPMPAVVNLFRILDRHPELLEETGLIQGPGQQPVPGAAKSSGTSAFPLRRAAKGRRQPRLRQLPA